jgi:replicative DNA helicase
MDNQERKMAQQKQNEVFDLTNIVKDVVTQSEIEDLILEIKDQRTLKDIIKFINEQRKTISTGEKANKQYTVDRNGVRIMKKPIKAKLGKPIQL